MGFKCADRREVAKSAKKYTLIDFLGVCLRALRGFAVHLDSIANRRVTIGKQALASQA